jgi:hypothetical protein
MVPFKDYNNKPRNIEVQFNLEVREVIKLLNEFNVVFAWQEAAKGDFKEYTTPEVVDFYNAFENILLSAWGEMTPDGLQFKKAGRYEFEESKLFAACMEIYISQPEETNKLVNGIMPEGMEELIKKSQGNMEDMKANPDTPPNIRAEIERLQALQAAEEAKQGATQA